MGHILEEFEKHDLKRKLLRRQWFSTLQLTSPGQKFSARMGRESRDMPASLAS
jgi:hypothetical protein